MNSVYSAQLASLFVGGILLITSPLSESVYADSPPHAESSITGQESSSSEAPHGPASGPLIAEYNGKKVLQKDIETELERPELVMLSQTLGEERDKERKLKITALMSIISRNLLLDAARASSTASKIDLTTEIDSFVKNQGGKDKLLPLLQKHNMPWERFIGELQEGLLLKRYVEDEVANNVSISNEDIVKAFKRNPTAFDIPEKARARHILFRAEEQKIADAQAKATRALELITSGSSSFEDFAANYSDDKITAQRGGDLGEFSRGTMLQEFESVVFTLEPGSISSPVTTKYGVHLIKVEQRIPGIPATLENSSDSIRQKLLTQARAEALSTHIKELQDKARIVILDSSYQLREAAK